MTYTYHNNQLEYNSNSFCLCIHGMFNSIQFCSVEEKINCIHIYTNRGLAGFISSKTINIIISCINIYVYTYIYPTCLGVYQEHKHIVTERGEASFCYWQMECGNMSASGHDIRCILTWFMSWLGVQTDKSY